MKKFRILLAVLMVVACLFAVLAIATSAEEASETEEKTITISFMNTSDTLSTSTTLDTTAHADGKITVTAGEKFTLPTTSTDSNTGTDGFQLVWYTENGRTYMAGEEVSFDEDTKLFRCAAKEAGTASDVTTALKTSPYAVILTDDIEYSSYLGLNEEKHNIIILNGHNMTFKGNINGLGAKRSGEYIYGKGTISFVDYTGTPGSNYVFQAQSHSHGGAMGRNVIGVDVTINAPNHKLINDGDVAYVTGYPWVKIYGNINVYHLGSIQNQGNRAPRIEIFEGATITLNWAEMMFCDRRTVTWNTLYVENYQSFHLTITGGTFNLPKEAENFEYWSADLKETVVDGNKTYQSNAITLANADVFSITGGSYNVKLPFEILKNGYECIYNETTGYYDVVYVGCTVEGSEGAHNFVVSDSYEGMVSSCEGTGVYYFRCECGSYYIDTIEAIGHDYSVLASETPATCTAKAYKTYKCVRCDSTQNVEYGSALGHDYSKVEILTVATSTTTGVKKFICTACGDSYELNYAVDPADMPITIVVKTEDGTKEITLAIKDALKLTYSGTLTTFTGVADSLVISDTESYTKEDIVKLTLPVGITNVATGAFDGYTALEELAVADGTSITFATGSFKNCPALTKLTLGEGSYVFSAYTVYTTKQNDPDATSCPLFATIDMTKANVTFETNAFKCNTAIKYIPMSAGHTYSFGKDSFREAGLVELIFPDNSTISWGVTAFAEGQSLEYIYFGSNIGVTQIKDTDIAFDGVSNLKKVVIMDLTYIGQYSFSTKTPGQEFGPLCNLEVYIHSSTISFHNQAFNTRNKTYEVYFYTVASITNNFANCNYVVYTGIPHKYVAEDSAPTCTLPGSTGYSTDCPCGVVAGATYSVRAYSSYTGDTAGGTITIGDTTPANGHKFSTNDGATVVATTPASCGKNSTTTYKCANCDATQTVENENTATEHVLGEWVITVNASCTTDGEKQQSCTICNAIVNAEAVPAIGHDTEGVEWTKTADPTCTLAGTELKYCATCGVVAETQPIAKLGHTEGEWVITLDPDCDDDGLKKKSCTVCQTLIATEVIEKLGHEYDLENGAELIAISYPNGFTVNGQSSIDCARCTIVDNFEIEPLFGAKGYSTNSTHTALNGGFTVNTELLPLYEQFNGTITYGVIIANANTFGENSFVDADNKVNNPKAMQVQIITKSYTSFDCTISNFGAYSSTLELIITAYVIDAEGNISFIQAENDYAIDTTVGEQTFTKVTLDLVVANVTEQPDAILPDEQ